MGTPAEGGTGLRDMAFWGIGLFDGTSTWLWGGTTTNSPASNFLIAFQIQP